MLPIELPKKAVLAMVTVFAISALYDMDCPMSMVETHLLCKLLDCDNSGDIEYTKLSLGLRHYM